MLEEGVEKAVFSIVEITKQERTAVLYCLVYCSC